MVRQQLASILTFVLACMAMITATSVCLGGPRDDYAVAAKLYARGLYKEAAAGFEKFIADYPADTFAGEARFFQAEANVQIKEYTTARDNFRKFLTASPNHKFAKQALYRVGECSVLIGDSKTAKPDLQQFVKTYGNDPLAAFTFPNLADICLADGELDAALEYYRTTLERFPNSGRKDDCRLGAAKILRLQGKLTASREFLEFLIANSKDKVVEHAKYEIALLEREAGNLEDAANGLLAVIKDYPESEVANPARLHAASVLYKLGRFAEAESALEKHVLPADSPEQSTVRMLRGRIARAQGDVGEARGFYESIALSFAASDEAPFAVVELVELAQPLGFDAVDDTVSSHGRILNQHAELKLAVDLMVADAAFQAAKHDRVIAIGNQFDSATSPAEQQIVYFQSLSHLAKQEWQAVLDSLAKLPATECVIPEHGQTVAKAAAYAGLGKHAEAASQFRQAIAGSEEDRKPDLQKQMLFAMIDAGDLASVEQELNAKSVPLTVAVEADIRSHLAAAALNAKDRELARRQYTTIKSLSGVPQDIAMRALSGLAWLDSGAENPDTSAESVNALIERFPESPAAAQAAITRAQSLDQQQKADEALAAYLQVIESFPNSPAYETALLGAGRLYDQLNRKRDAAQTFATYVEKFPKSPRLDEVLYQWAWTATDSNDSETAQRLFTALHDEHPDSSYWSDATYRLAEAAVAAQNPLLAEKLVGEVLAKEADKEIRGHALYLKARIAASQNRWTEVGPPLEELRQLLPTSPLLAGGDFWYAESLYRQGKFEDAGRRFKELEINAGENPPVWLATVVLRRAQVSAQQQDWASAFKIASTIETRFPGYQRQYEVDYLLGRCHGSRAEFNEARARYQKVINSEIGGQTETAAMAQWMIGETFFQQKQYDDAIAAYQRISAMTIASTDEVSQENPLRRWEALAYLQAGKCHEVQGQWEDAIRLYTVVIQQFPESTFTQEASRRLRVVKQRLAMQETPNSNTNR